MDKIFSIPLKWVQSLKDWSRALKIRGILLVDGEDSTFISFQPFVLAEIVERARPTCRRRAGSIYGETQCTIYTEEWTKQQTHTGGTNVTFYYFLFLYIYPIYRAKIIIYVTRSLG